MEFTGERFVECSATAGQLIEREHWQRYLMAAQLIEAGNVVLDIACGTGYGSAHLADKAQCVYGVDISAEAIEFARNTYPRGNVHFLQGSVEQIPLAEGSVDVVISFETIEHVGEEQQHAFLKEVLRVLRPGGRLVVSCPNKPIASDLPYELWGYVNEFHKKEYDQKGFQSLLEQYFSHISFLYQRSETALIIDAPGVKSLGVLWGERKDYGDAQNIIAFCGATPFDPRKFASVIPDLGGSHLANQRLVAELSKTVQTQTNDAQRLVEQNAVSKSVIAQKDREISANATFIQQLQSAVAAKDQDIAELVLQMKELESAIDEKDRAIRDNAAFIQQLQNAITAKDLDITSLVSAMDGMKVAIGQKDTAAEEAAVVIEQLQRRMEAHDSDIRKLTLHTNTLEETDAQKEQTIADRDAQIIALPELIKKQEEEIAHKTQTLEKIECSFIWRMSAPLRTLIETVKHKLRGEQGDEE